MFLFNGSSKLTSVEFNLLILTAVEPQKCRSFLVPVDDKILRFKVFRFLL